MTTVTLDKDSRTGRKRNITKFPYTVQKMSEQSLPISEEELIPLEEFKQYFENRIHERLGLKITF